MVKAVSFFGNDLSGTHFRDTKEILGNMPMIYDKVMAFLKSNLHNVQEEGASFNTLGKLEIAEPVLEEVVQNALIHRDLLRQAPIRVFIFDNRVEVISPGALAGGLTEDDIRKGKTYQRNPHMATFATNALHYRGIGSGIVRILADCPDVEIENDAEGQEFKVTLWRAIQKGEVKECNTNQKREVTTETSNKTTETTTETSNKATETTTETIYKLICKNPKITAKEIASLCGITEDGVAYHIKKLKSADKIIRIGGSRNGGEWKVN